MHLSNFIALLPEEALVNCPGCSTDRANDLLLLLLTFQA
jgi:hypothetical protein